MSLPNQKKQRTAREVFQRRPMLECLEDRVAPAVFNVSPLTTDGLTNSLRSALSIASTNGQSDTINLQQGIFELILPLGGGLDILPDRGQSLTIQGAGRDLTFIDANGRDRVLDIVNDSGSPLNVTFRNLSIVGGDSFAEAGGVRITGSGSATVTFENVGIGTNVVDPDLSSQGNRVRGFNGINGFAGNVTTVLNQTFANDNGITKSQPFFSNGANSYFGISDGAAGIDFDGDPAPAGIQPYTGFSGGFFTARDIDSGPGNPNQVFILFDDLDISPGNPSQPLTNVQLSGAYASVVDLTETADSTDFVIVEYQTDNFGPFIPILAFRGNGNGLQQDADFDGLADGNGILLSQAAQTITSVLSGPITPLGFTLDLRIRTSLDGIDEDIGIDSLSLSGNLNVRLPGDGESVAGGGLLSNTTGTSTINLIGSTIIVNNQAFAGDGGDGGNANQGNGPGQDGGNGGFALGAGASFENAIVNIVGDVTIGNNELFAGDGGNGGTGFGSGKGGDGGDGGVGNGGGFHVLNTTVNANGLTVIDNALQGGDGGDGGNAFTAANRNNGGEGGRGGDTAPDQTANQGGGIYADLASVLNISNGLVARNQIVEGNAGDGGDGDNASGTANSPVAGDGGDGGNGAPIAPAGGGGIFLGGGGASSIGNVVIAENTVMGGQGGTGGRGGNGSLVITGGNPPPPANRLPGEAGNGGRGGNTAGAGLQIAGSATGTTVLNVTTTTVRNNALTGGAGGAGGDGGDGGFAEIGAAGGTGGTGGEARGGGVQVDGRGDGVNASVLISTSTIGASNFATGGNGGVGGLGGLGDALIGGAGGIGGVGGLARGGGIEINAGLVTTSNVTISTNAVTGGAGGMGGPGRDGGPGINGSAGGNGGNGGNGEGGGIAASLGDANIRNSTIAVNNAQFGTGAEGGPGGAGGTGAAGGPGGGGGASGSGRGGGGFNEGTRFDVTLISSLFGDNTSSTSPDYFGAASAFSSFVENVEGASWTGTGIVGGVDADLGPLQANGGPTFTHALDPDGNNDSFAINAGLNLDSLTGDQRGFTPRNAEGAPDIGAYETGAVNPFTQLYAVGTDAGVEALVLVYDAQSRLLYGLNPFPGFIGGVRVATGDVNGDRVDDIIVGAGPGGGPHVKVFDGATQAEIFSFFAYVDGFRGGVNVAVGDVNNDGFADIITGAGAGGGPHVKVFDGRNAVEIRSFFAYVNGFAGGVNVAAGDVNDDGFSDIITGAGPGGGPHVRAFSGRDISVLRDFFAYDAGFAGGVFVSSGDINADGVDDIITGAGAGGGPHVRIFSGLASALLTEFFAYADTFQGGVRVSTIDRDADGSIQVLTAAGPGGGPHVKSFRFSPFQELDSFFALGNDFVNGLFIG